MFLSEGFENPFRLEGEDSVFLFGFVMRVGIDPASIVNSVNARGGYIQESSNFPRKVGENFSETINRDRLPGLPGVPVKTNRVEDGFQMLEIAEVGTLRDVSDEGFNTGLPELICPVGRAGKCKNLMTLRNPFARYPFSQVTAADDQFSHVGVDTFRIKVTGMNLQFGVVT